MRLGVCVPQSGPFLDPSVMETFVRRLEAAGTASLWVSDHVVVPEGHGYIPERLLDPLALLAHLAAVTERPALGTSVLILPYRAAIPTGKLLSSIDVFARGRLVVGVGVGWMPEEFAALGIPFAERAARTDECIDVWRNLWTTETSSFDGRFDRYEGIRFFPKASAERTGTIPVVVGGNTPAAIERAAVRGDGWHPINLSFDDLRDGVARYRERCGAAGREPGPVILRHMPGGRTEPEGGWTLTGSPDQQRADLAAYAEAGCDEVLLSWADRDPSALADRLEAVLALRAGLR